MLPGTERLRRASLFQRTYAGRKSISSPLVTLYVLSRQPRSAPKAPLVGFVVGKKVNNKAVCRNRAKRRLREAYRRMRLAQESLRQWYSMVWVVHTKLLDASFEEIESTVADLIVKVDRKYGKRLSPSEGKQSSPALRDNESSES